MARIANVAWIAALIMAGGTAPLLAQDGRPFAQREICDGDRVSKKKFFAVAIKNAANTVAMVTDDGSIDPKALYWQASDHFDTFKEEYLDKPNTFYVVTKGREHIKSGEDLVRNARRYEIGCIVQPPTLRSRLDDVTKKVSAHVVVGKDLDALNKPLNSRSPARVSVTRDNVSDNTAFQTEFAVAGNFSRQVEVNDTTGKPHTVFFDFQPFVTSQSTSNSNVKVKDIDKTTVGLMLYVDSLPFFVLGTNHFSFRGGFQTDTTKAYEAGVGELVWWPRFGPFRALGFGEYYELGGNGGLWVRYDISGRVRAGEIYENLGIPTLPKEGVFARAGGKAELSAGFGGADVLSGLSLNASYLYFENLRGGNGIDFFDKWVLELNYQLTQNYGFSISYTRGLDEDLLKPVDAVVGAVTIKFGDLNR